jgi:integrase
MASLRGGEPLSQGLEARCLAKPILERIAAERAGIVEDAAPKRSPVTWELVCKTYRANEDLWPTNAKTAKRYEIDLAKIGAFLEARDTRPAEIDAACVRELVAAMRKEGLKTSSVKHRLSVFSCAMSAAAFADLIDDNPVRGFDRKRLKGAAAALNPPLNGEFERLLPEVERLAPEMVDYVEFLHRTGCRAGEALHARRSDVIGEPGSRLVNLHEGVKRDASRTILLNSAEELLEGLPETGRLFPGLPTSVQDVSSLWGRFWKRRRAEAEKVAAAEGRALTDWERRRWRLHDLRAAFAVNAEAAVILPL